jgi:hypothetical protein
MHARCHSKPSTTYSRATTKTFPDLFPPYNGLSHVFSDAVPSATPPASSCSRFPWLPWSIKPPNTTSGSCLLSSCCWRSRWSLQKTSQLLGLRHTSPVNSPVILNYAAPTVSIGGPSHTQPSPASKSVSYSNHTSPFQSPLGTSAVPCLSESLEGSRSSWRESDPGGCYCLYLQGLPVWFFERTPCEQALWPYLEHIRICVPYVAPPTS